jgi:ubiquinone/menaquinone biosynthesis C-methylase UbiE
MQQAPAQSECLNRGLTLDDTVLASIRAYWNDHIHDLAIATQPAGTAAFYQQLDDYRYAKLSYLRQVIDCAACQGQRLLEIGCGTGIDLVRWARAGAMVTGIDLAPAAVELARQYLAQQGLPGEVRVMNGEALEFEDNSFDLVYAHGVLQYTANAVKMVNEIRRVLRPGGQAILMVYNKHSWLNALSKLTKVELEHADAPVIRKYSIREFRCMLGTFMQVKIVPERFPVKTRLHHGLKARIYNGGFVGLFNLLPIAVIRPLGWHLLAFAHK